MKLDPRTQVRLRNNIIDNVLAKYYFPSYEIRIILHLMRKTIGWNRTDYYSTYREIAKATSMPVGKAHATCQTLSAKGIIAARRTKKKTHFQFNINYMAWDLKEPDTLFTDNALLPEEVTKSVTPGGNREGPELSEVRKFIQGLKAWKKIS